MIKGNFMMIVEEGYPFSEIKREFPLVLCRRKKE